MLHSDFRVNLIRIHLLYHAKNNHAITAAMMYPEIERHGYNTNMSEIQNELDHLKSENFFTIKDEEYYITEAGDKELSEVQEKVKILNNEIN